MTVLLMLPARKQIFPMSTVALTQAQTPRDELENGYREAYLLDAEGLIRRIEHIEVLGPFGDSWFRKLISRLSNGWRIATRLSDPIEWELDRLKAIILECLGPDFGNADGDAGANLPQVLADLKGATTPAQVYGALRLPPPEEALDVL